MSEKNKSTLSIIGVILFMLWAVYLGITTPSCEEMYDDGLITYEEFKDCVDDEERYQSEEYWGM